MTQQGPVAVELFSTSILSNHKVRSRHERYVSILQVKRIPFVYHDLASDEQAKSRWRRTARDPQIPGLLVHDEWRGTFEEFEESIELGELDLFLRIDLERAKREADEGIIPQPAPPQPQPSSSNGNTAPQEAATPRKPSKHVVKTVQGLAQPRQPSMTALAPALPMAAPSPASTPDKRSGKNVDVFLRSLGIDDLNLTEEELNEVLEAGQTSAEKRAGGDDVDATSVKPSQAQDGTDKKYPGIGLGTSSSQKPVPRTYIPSADAGTKPLRLAKMGDSTRASSSTAGAPIARYNASQTSSRALAAEAQASASSRSFSTSKLREAVSQGDDLKAAMSQTRLASNTDSAEQVVGREDIDDLLASLGLDDVKMTDEEAEAFLFDGTIPQNTSSGGARLGRSASGAERARNEAAARDVARRAREKGYGSNSDSGSSRSPSIHNVHEESEEDEEKKDDEHDTSVIIKPDSPAATKIESKEAEAENVQEETDTSKSTIAAEETKDDQKEADVSEASTQLAEAETDVEEPKVKAESATPSSEQVLVEQSTVPVDKAQSSEDLKADEPEKKMNQVENETDDVPEESTPRQRISELPETEDEADKEDASVEDVRTKFAVAGLGEEGERSADSAGTAKILQKDGPAENEAESAQEDVAHLEAAPPSEEKQKGQHDSSHLEATPSDVTKLEPEQKRAASSPTTSPRTSSKPASPASQKSTSSPSRAPRDSVRMSLLQLDSSFSALASQIQTGDRSSAGSFNQSVLMEEPTEEEEVQSKRVEPNVTPSSPTDGSAASVKTSVNAAVISPSPTSAARVSASSPPPSADGRASSSSPRSPGARSPLSPSGTQRSQTSRRKAIDVQRPNMSSPSSDISFNTGNGRSVSLGRSGSYNSEMYGTSPEATRGTKSPLSAGKKLFSLGRRSKEKKNRPSAGSLFDGEADDDDIPTTVDPSLVESRSSTTLGGAGGARGEQKSMDRSQKTLSVILREADEAMSGMDGDGDDDDYAGDGHDDDQTGAFDFDVDIDGADDGIEFERS